MKFLKYLLGIENLEKRILKIEEKLQNSDSENSEDTEQILEVLTRPFTTIQIAEKLKKSRSRVSSLLNELERTGKVKEVGKIKREILYKKTINS